MSLGEGALKVDGPTCIAQKSSIASEVTMVNSKRQPCGTVTLKEFSGITERVQWNKTHTSRVGGFGSKIRQISQVVNSSDLQRSAKQSRAEKCNHIQAPAEPVPLRTSLPDWASTTDPIVLSRG